MNAVFWITALKAGAQALKVIQWAMARGRLPTERADVQAALEAFRAEQSRLARNFEQGLQAELETRKQRQAGKRA